MFIIINFIEKIRSFIKKLTEDKNYKKLKDYINQGYNVFITGRAGIGKSFLLNKVKKDFLYIHITSTTGISAINVNGQTIHSWAGVGICNQPTELTIYEILMLNSDTLHIISYW